MRHDLAVAGASPLQGLAQGSNSACRPTNRVSPRAANACKRSGGAGTDQLEHLTGSASPLTETGPRALTWTNPSASRRSPPW